MDTCTRHGGESVVPGRGADVAVLGTKVEGTLGDIGKNQGVRVAEWVSYCLRTE